MPRLVNDIWGQNVVKERELQSIIFNIRRNKNKEGKWYKKRGATNGRLS